MTSLTELNDDTVRTMSIGAVFSDFVSLPSFLLFFLFFFLIDCQIDQLLLKPYSPTNVFKPIALKSLLHKFQVGKINSIDFHRKEDLLVTASEDDSVRFYDIANAKWVYLFIFYMIEQYWFVANMNQRVSLEVPDSRLVRC